MVVPRIPKNKTMKLIKINTDHYIIVDDSKIEIGDWVLYKNSYIATVLGFPTDGGEGLKIQVVGDRGKIKTDFSSCKKITHSTEPLEAPVAINGFENYAFISLSEVKELIGEVDVEQKYNASWLRKYESHESKEGIAFKTGYNQALEDNKDKKYTEEDMINWTMCMIAQYVQGNTNIWNKDLLRKSLPTPKTEWDCCIFDGKLALL